MTVLPSTRIYEGTRIPYPVPTILEVDPSKHRLDDILTVNFGPNHPSTHGVLRLVVDLDGETVAGIRAVIGYLHTGFEKNMELFVAGMQIEIPRAGVDPRRGHFVVNDEVDLTEVPHQFDFAIASAQVRRLSLNAVARTFASVIRKLAPGGRFYVSWPEADAASLPPTREPYEYSFDMLARIAELTGGRAERVVGASHPRGESLMVIHRR